MPDLSDTVYKKWLLGIAGTLVTGLVIMFIGATATQNTNRLHNLEQSQKDHDRRITRSEARLDEHARGYIKLSQDMEKLDSKLERLDTKIDTVLEKVSDLHRR